MKSKQALEAEIKSVAKVWNATDDKDPYSASYRMAYAVYHALRWANGHYQTERPSVNLMKELGRSD